MGDAHGNIPYSLREAKPRRFPLKEGNIRELGLFLQSVDRGEYNTNRLIWRVLTCFIKSDIIYNDIH